MSTVVICVGIPASGKSTWASKMTSNGGAMVICRDNIRIALGLKHGDDEKKITDIAYQLLEDAISDGRDVIIADTNVITIFRDRLVKFCTDSGAKVELKVFPISLEEAIKRDANREDSVGAEVVTRMYWQLEHQINLGLIVDSSERV